MSGSRLASGASPPSVPAEVAPSPKARVLTVTAGRQALRVSVADDHAVTTDAPPLLLINGLGANLEMWQPLTAALGGRALVAFDAPGTGESPAPSFPPRLPSLANTLSTMLDELGLQQVDALGYSFGGALAQQLAKQSPERVRRLILAATTYGLGSRPGSMIAWSMIMTPLRYHSRTALAIIAPYAMGGRSARDPSIVDPHAAARLSRPPSLWGYQSQLSATLGWTSRPWLGRITQRTLVLAGDQDPINPLANGRTLARCIPDARLVVIRGGGHAFLLDQPREAATAIARFVDAN
jgi:poly(3-hydroxyoctanoate) depolymerase